MESKNESFGLQGSLTICDWGSSHLRAYLVGENGEILRKYQSAKGAKALAGDQSSYRDELLAALKELQVGTESEIRISGMAGSKLGWKETEYCATPLSMSACATNYLSLEGFPNARLMGGAKHQDADDAMDVMRGEEVQVFGCMELHPEARLICLPGTHSKWVKVEGQKIISFKTYMTGDLFHSLCVGSIFKEQITSEEFHREGFLAGCRLAIEGNDLHDLFKLRSAFVFSKVSGDDFHSYLSGFLIANEIKSAKLKAANVHLCGAPSLISLYRLAMSEMKMAAFTVDSEAATIRGHLSLLSL